MRKVCTNSNGIFENLLIEFDRAIGVDPLTRVSLSRGILARVFLTKGFL